MRFSKDAARYAPNDYVLLADYAVNFYAAENFDIEADWLEAAKAWETARAKATSVQQRFYTWLNEARVLGMAGDWRRAGERSGEALKLRPDNESAQALLDRAQGELAGR
ncbi:MAG: hypothetical protein IIB38_08755 [Candidatus Hydrogenedentes bacterium]|nr:hypothetical protein [Candidatus Hydrogenedentota bacterium]